MLEHVGFWIELSSIASLNRARDSNYPVHDIIREDDKTTTGVTVSQKLS